MRQNAMTPTLAAKMLREVTRHLEGQPSEADAYGAETLLRAALMLRQCGYDGRDGRLSIRPVVKRLWDVLRAEREQAATTRAQ